MVDFILNKSSIEVSTSDNFSYDTNHRKLFFYCGSGF